MKYILLSTILFLSCSSFAQKTIKEKDIPFLDGKYYYKGKPLDGIYKVKFSKPRAHFSEVATYVDGIKEGKAKLLRFNKLEEEGNYSNNKKEGIWNKYFYIGGRLEEVSTYRNGIKEGVEIKYNSVTIDSLFYANDLLDGMQFTHNLYKGRTESLYDKGTIQSSVSYDLKGEVKEKCVYSGYKGENKTCATYIKLVKDNELVIYTDSLFSKKECKKIKRYLNDTLEFQVVINKKDYKYFIMYYKEDELIMLDEVFADIYIDFSEMILERIVSETRYNDFSRLMYNNFRCSFHPFIFDLDEPYYIYRKNKDGTFSKRRYRYYEGALDILPGCIEDKVSDNVELPKIDSL